mmetsp:Transcript_28511/g.60164  ORF Transcript_28511/g.60164 Transcript_28511/m.60164 type:complete len:487 (+) Transcript_28511:161-1621(+)
MAPRSNVIDQDLAPSEGNGYNYDAFRAKCIDAEGTHPTKDEGSTASPPCSLRQSPMTILPPSTTLCILVMIDMFSVSLVVPLLHQYYKNAGVSSASQRELLSSLFSSSQIAGGLIIGALSDVGILSRRRILFLSFLGSALSYALIVVGGLRNLIVSRVLVGLVKQTMTVSTSLLARYTTSETRAVSMGRLTASTTAAWIAGPSVGALLYKHVDPSAPALTASGLFLLNSALAAILLPADDERGEGDATKNATNGKSRGKVASFTSNLKTCFSSSSLASVVTSLLLLGWVTRTTSYANMASFYEEKYGVEPHYRGYIKSYQQSLHFLFTSFFVRVLLTACGGERRAAVLGAFMLAGATLCEVNASFEVFLCIVSPAIAVSVGILGVSLRSLVTQVTPKESLGSVLAALDVLQNAASVTVPFYRTLLFNLAARYGSKDEDASMVGDPDPKVWLLSSFFHWSLFAVAISFLLSPKLSSRHKDDTGKKNR